MLANQLPQCAGRILFGMNLVNQSDMSDQKARNHHKKKGAKPSKLGDGPRIVMSIIHSKSPDGDTPNTSTKCAALAQDSINLSETTNQLFPSD